MSTCRLTLAEPPHISEFRITHLYGVNSQKTYCRQLKRGRISVQGLLLLFLWACYRKSTWQRKLLTWQQPGSREKRKKVSGDESYSSKSHLNDSFFFRYQPFNHELINGLVKSDPSMQSSSRTNLQTCFNTESYVLHKVIRSRLYLTLRGQWTYAGDSVEVVRTL